MRPFLRVASLLTLAVLPQADQAQIFFGPNLPDVTLAAKDRTQAVVAIADAVRDHYVFPAIGDRISVLLRKNLSAGRYASVTSCKAFADLVTKDMAPVAHHDEHLRVICSYYPIPAMPPPPDPGTPEPITPQEREAAQARNYGFKQVSQLDGNIGLLSFEEFTGDTQDGGQVLAGAMAFLANTDALIIDLRNNHGGSPGTVNLLASYFFGDGAVHLDDMAFRVGKQGREIFQDWTQPFVPGQKYLDKQVYLLTSHQTFSAAEAFAYNMQAQKRVTIVGESTGGGANPGNVYRLGAHLAVFVPRGTAINPITKTNWEGKGVQPDVRVPSEAALVTAEKMALQHLIGMTKDERRLMMLKAALAKVSAGGAATSTP